MAATGLRFGAPVQDHIKGMLVKTESTNRSAFLCSRVRPGLDTARGDRGTESLICVPSSDVHSMNRY